MTKGRILICGYYDRHNYGDDAFVSVLSEAWKLHHITIKNLEQVEPKDVEQADLIVLGGGDLLQEYFLSRVETLILPYKTCPLYAVGVSMPYKSAMENGRLDMIDGFWCRFRSDTELLRKRFGSERVSYIPDLALLSTLPLKDTHHHSHRHPHDKKRIGICFSMSLVAGSHKSALVTQIRNLIERLLSMEYEVNWLAFNNDTSEKESDVLLYNLLPPSTRLQVKLYQGSKLIPALTEMDLLVATRFHAHVFRYLAQVPVVSLVLTRKVDQWNRDHNLDRTVVSLPRKCNYCCDTQVSCKCCECCEAFMGHVTSLPITEITNKVRLNLKATHNVSREIVLLTQSLKAIVSDKWSVRITPPYFVSKDLVTSYYDFFQKQWSEFVSGTIDSEFMASIICLKLTGNIHHPFHYGLSQGLKVQGANFNLRDSLDHMVRKYYSEEIQWGRSLVSREKGLFSLNRIPQNRLEGSHRSGWQHVVGLLSHFHNDDAPLLDTFIDKTFGWHAEYLESLEIIPYKQPWYGFLHHPAKAVFSKNDASHLFKRPSLLTSLSQCKGLFVMGAELGQWLTKRLRQLEMEVPVHVIYHPTEDTVPGFKWKKFLANPNPQVVQIGAWLRDPYAIFQLEVPSLQKSVLKCKDMVGYLENGPPKAVSGDVIPEDPTEPSCRDIGGGECKDCECMDCECKDCDTNPTNPFMNSVQRMLNDQWESVQIVDHLSNDDYDQLLTENIAFIPLLKAVAVNTVLECIIRNTPMIVKRLPDVEWYLGQRYPGFYNTYHEAEGLLSDRVVLRKCYDYLKGMDKTFLTEEYFMASMKIAVGQACKSD